MIEYYLRVEAVNFEPFIFDTNDLKTIRGGGLLLLDAPDRVLKVLKSALIEISPDDEKEGPVPERITTGASWGLFRFTARDDAKASLMAAYVREKLKSDEKYKHATFVLDVTRITDDADYRKLTHGLHALNRWRQMRSPTVKVPEIIEDPIRVEKKNGDKKNIRICEFDFVRPARDAKPIKDDRYGLSSSVLARRDYGGKNKKWYIDQTGIENLSDFVENFNDLATASKNQDVGELNRKMAVIYLDGNGFGKLRSKYCRDEARQRRYDETMRKKFQNATLKELLEKINEDDLWKTGNASEKAKPKDEPGASPDSGDNNGPQIRLETLLWGGDEIIWVVPAWRGWWMLANFYRHVEEHWRFPNEGNQLTLSGGLVFCHYKAPIHRITKLARSLGDLAKSDRSKNLVAYEILESFDHAGIDPALFRERRRPGQVNPAEMYLDGNLMEKIIEPVRKIKSTLPKRRLHRMIETLYRDSDEAEDLRKQLENFKDMEKSDLETIKLCLGARHGRWGCWLHLYELWDYILPGKKGDGDAPQ